MLQIKLKVQFIRLMQTKHDCFVSLSIHSLRTLRENYHAIE